MGAGADVSSGALSNATAIGSGAIVNASNKVRIGNASVTVIEGQVAYTFPSDSRLKTDITNIDAGLEFIKKLKPVSYRMKNSTDSRANWGFIAQDIEELVGTKNMVLTIGEDSERTLGLRYSDFVAPLVKAVQEQQTQIEDLKTENAVTKAELAQLKMKLTQYESLSAQVDELKKLMMEKESSVPSAEKSISMGGNKR